MKREFFLTSIKSGLAIALLTLTGCAESNRRILEGTSVTACEPLGAFTAALAKEYEKLGKIEQDIMFDEYSATYYYEKAIRSKQGACVGPTFIEKWDIECDKRPALQQARERLIVQLDRGARIFAPELAAKAQAHFDCWVEQQAEGWQENDIAWCRGEFFGAMRELEQK